MDARVKPGRDEAAVHRPQIVSSLRRRLLRRAGFPTSIFWASGPDPLPYPQRLDLQFALRLEQIAGDLDLASALADPQHPVSRRQHARGRAGVPGPAAAPAVAVTVVDVGGLLIGIRP